MPFDEPGALSPAERGRAAARTIGVHVVRITGDFDFASAHRALDEVEKLRAARLDSSVRVRYVAGRAAARVILSRYLTTLPESIRFLRTHGQPPRLTSRLSGEELEFSFATSGSLAAIAIATGPRFGLDVEQFRDERFSSELATAVLSSAERTSYAATAEGNRTRWLAATWVAKEAVLKAWQTGLAVSPDSLDAGLPVHAAPATGHWRRLRRPGDFSVWQFDWHDGCLAVAATGELPAVQLTEHFISDLLPPRAR